MQFVTRRNVCRDLHSAPVPVEFSYTDIRKEKQQIIAKPTLVYYAPARNLITRAL